MLSNNEKAFARMDSAAIQLVPGYAAKPSRSARDMDLFIGSAHSRATATIVKRAELKQEAKLMAMACAVYQGAMDALQGVVLGAPDKVQKELIKTAHQMREGGLADTNRRAARNANTAIYQLILRDWPSLSPLPEALLQDILQIPAAPRALPVVFADSETEEYRKGNAFMLVSGVTSLDNALKNGNLAKAETLVEPSVMCQLRHTVLHVSAELRPQQAHGHLAFDALTRAYAATLTAGVFATMNDQQQIAQASAMRHAMTEIGEVADDLKGLDQQTRLHYAVAFAERALVDTVGDAGQNQVRQVAMLVMGLDPNLSGGGPGARNNPPTGGGATKQSRKLN